MKILLTALFTLMVSISFLYAQADKKVAINDLKTLVGSWTGTLTYLDYSTGKPYTMPADVKIRQLGSSGSFIFSNLYPDEPKANSADTVSIADNGNMLNKEMVKVKIRLANNNLEIITEFSGTDGNDNTPATIRTTYMVGRKIFKNVKEVQFAGEDKWIKRHEYSYTRK